MTEDQVQRLEDLNEKLQEQRRQQFENLRNQGQDMQEMTDEQRRERFETMRQEMEKQQQETRKQVGGILNAEQKTRAMQLEFQFYLQRGAVDQALRAAGVELSEADLTKLNEAQDAIRQKTEQQIAEIQRKAQAEILATVLSSQKVEELSGKPFEFASRREGPPGFGAGGNRPQRGPGGGDAGRPERPPTDQPNNAGGRRGRRE